MNAKRVHWRSGNMLVKFIGELEICWTSLLYNWKHAGQVYWRTERILEKMSGELERHCWSYLDSRKHAGAVIVAIITIAWISLERGLPVWLVLCSRIFLDDWKNGIKLLKTRQNVFRAPGTVRPTLTRISGQSNTTEDGPSEGITYGGVSRLIPHSHL